MSYEQEREKRIKSKIKRFKREWKDDAPNVIDEIISALRGFYIYDNSEAYETRKDEIEEWKMIKEKL